MKQRFMVNVGYNRAGRPKNHYFGSLDAAKRFVGAHFQRTKVVLSIVQTPWHKVA
jgi:hypothetical protein